VFTGVVQQLGEVASLVRKGGAAAVRLRAKAWKRPATPGESICVSGVCLTVVERCDEDCFDARFDLVEETLSRTTLGELEEGDAVNLEPSLTPTTPISGHFVQGHVDGTALVAAMQDRDAGAWLTVELPEGLGALCPVKGSIALDGVSLTIAASEGDRVSVALIPETLARTTLGRLREGARCNVEADCLARIVQRCLAERGLLDGQGCTRSG